MLLSCSFISKNLSTVCFPENKPIFSPLLGFFKERRFELHTEEIPMFELESGLVRTRDQDQRKLPKGIPMDPLWLRTANTFLPEIQ